MGNHQLLYFGISYTLQVQWLLSLHALCNQYSCMHIGIGNGREAVGPHKELEGGSECPLRTSGPKNCYTVLCRSSAGHTYSSSELEAL